MSNRQRGAEPTRSKRLGITARLTKDVQDAQAAALGWRADDLFGLAPIPDIPKPSFQRLSRYDLIGLVWLLRGRPVIALTEITAVIKTASGTLAYRRHNKPALGPLGDSLEDFT